MKSLKEIMVIVVGTIFSIPARIKGVKFGANSLIGPGYDFISTQMKNIFVGNGVTIGKFAWIQTIGKGKINIDNGTSIGRNVTISCHKKISIGKNCLFSYNVSLLDHHHKFDNKSISVLHQGISKGDEITIGDDCFIGAHVFIMPGVKLGKHVVVGANSVVTKSFPGYCVVAGCPAKTIRKL